MTYAETIDYLFCQLPAFEVSGAGAYKPGLATAYCLSAAFGNPHIGLKAIHVAGTNGKGSTSHMLASVLMQAGYKVGLYTSPHLFDFRERIRVDGQMIDEASVTDFVERFLEKAFGSREIPNAVENSRKFSKILESSRDFSKDLEPNLLDCRPTFFELTTIMAFEYFRKMDVDIAVVETGLGGRLDTTNILTPMLSVITNVSMDHMAQLGDTIGQIAAEKAGIIKPGVPVVIGEAQGEAREVFERHARQLSAPIVFASEWIVGRAVPPTDLTGDFQSANIATVITALDILRGRQVVEGLTPDVVAEGLVHVKANTHLMGRWTEADIDGRHIILDPGHNEGAWRYTAPRLQALAREHELWVVLGFSADKDIAPILDSLPHRARYVWVNSAGKRALPAAQLRAQAEKRGLEGHAFDTVAAGVDYALQQSAEGATVFVGGSFYVLAEVPRRLFEGE